MPSPWHGEVLIILQVTRRCPHRLLMPPMGICSVSYSRGDESYYIGFPVFSIFINREVIANFGNPWPYKALQKAMILFQEKKVVIYCFLYAYYSQVFQFFHSQYVCWNGAWLWFDGDKFSSPRQIKIWRLSPTRM